MTAEATPDTRFFNLSRVLTGLIVSALLAIPVAYRVSRAILAGPGWDTYAFLVNAAEFAGKSVGYTEMHRPPMLSMITSIPFRFGWMDDSTIQVVDGIIWWIGLLALYAILRRRFSVGPSFLGTLVLLGIEPAWSLLGHGYSDHPSIALSIVAALLFIKATEDHPGWYAAAIPMLLTAALTRYGALIMVFPFLVWMYFRACPIRHHRQIFTGLGISGLIYLPAGINFASAFNDFLRPLATASAIAGGAFESTGATETTGWHLLYVQRILTLIGPEKVAVATAGVLGVACLGLVYGALAHLASMRPASLRRLVLPLALVGMAAMAQLNGGMAVRQGTIVLAVIVTWRVLGSRDEDGRVLPLMALDAMMLSWLLAYLDAHGHMTTQLPRYFVTMAPSMAYFLVRGWGISISGIRLSSRPQDASSPVVAHDRFVSVLAWGLLGIMVGGLLWQHADLGGPTPEKDKIVIGSEVTAQWLADRDLSDDTIIYSDTWPATSWYLGREAKPMPHFTDSRAYENELEKNEADYFVTLRSRRFENFEPVFAANSATILQRIKAPSNSRQQVLYLGDGWETYVEILCEFDFDLITDRNRYAMDGTAMLDSLSAAELSEYDAVALFGVKWNDFPAGEAAVREYVSSGGTLVADASRNLDGLSYPLVDTIFLDTIIRRASVRAEAKLTVNDDFAAAYRVSREISTSPFMDETGGAWFGATYEPLADSGARRVLARLDGRPVIIEQTMGNGRILWVGSNLIWHAFVYENDYEAGLVRALFDEVLNPHSAIGIED